MNIYTGKKKRLFCYKDKIIRIAEKKHLRHSGMCVLELPKKVRQALHPLFLEFQRNFAFATSTPLLDDSQGHHKLPSHNHINPKP
jgi:hypothetical protein